MTDEPNRTSKWNRILSSDREMNNDEYIADQVTHGKDLRAAIKFLIQRREQLRDAEIEWLEAQSGVLADMLRERRNQILIEELEAFNEIMHLHKRIADGNGQHVD